MDLVLVDGPNLFNAVGRQLVRDFPHGPHVPYLQMWFDVARLVAATLQRLEPQGGEPPALGTVIFRSARPLGRDPYRLGRTDEVEAFWGRQASYNHTSETLVTIPGTETDEYTCAACGCSVAKENREKGVDSSMIAYLFETVERWQSACLFTRDADFVPAVQALRRRGKRVFAAADEGSQGDALVRAVQSFVPWPPQFLAHDRQWFELLRPDGALDTLVRFIAQHKGGVQIRLRFGGVSIQAEAPDADRVAPFLDRALASVPLLPRRGGETGFGPDGVSWKIAIGGYEDGCSWGQQLSDAVMRNGGRLAAVTEWGKCRIE